VEVRWVRLVDDEVAPLLADLAREYDERYGSGDGEMASARPEQFDPPDGAFLVVLDEDGATVAGGGLRRWSAGTCEVKRMWTSPGHRRNGLATTVLAALEDRARSLGYSAIRLETGPAQPEALSFYRRRGYGEIPVYGVYERATAFERVLTPGG
jgi:GNAT superfamily N-acetyltransferase